MLVMCHMRVRTDCTWGYVEKFGKEDSFNNYDIRVLMTLVRADMFVENDLGTIAQMIGIVAHAISGFRKR